MYRTRKTYRQGTKYLVIEFQENSLKVPIRYADLPEAQEELNADKVLLYQTQRTKTVKTHYHLETGIIELEVPVEQEQPGNHRFLPYQDLTARFGSYKDYIKNMEVIWENKLLEEQDSSNQMRFTPTTKRAIR